MAISPLFRPEDQHDGLRTLSRLTDRFDLQKIERQGQRQKGEQFETRFSWN